MILLYFQIPLKQFEDYLQLRDYLVSQEMQGGMSMVMGTKEITAGISV